MIPDLLKEKISIFDVAVKLGIRLKKGKGRTQQCCCVLHQDSDPSARLYEDSNKFYCFACEEGGDVIWLVQRKMGIDFHAACEWLQREFGLKHDTTTREDLRARFSRAKRSAPSPATTTNPQSYLNLLQQAYLRLCRRSPSSAQVLQSVYRDCVQDFSVVQASNWYTESLSRLESALEG